MKLSKALAASNVFLLLFASVAVADVIVAPNAQTTAEGNDSNFGPFFDSFVRYQQVYSASQFPNSSAPLRITGIAFRPDASVSDPNLFIRFSGFQVRLSTTSRTAATLSSQFADNIGSDETTVLDSFAFVTAPVTGPAAGPKDFTIEFPLMTPFLYDPANGNLLMDVRAVSAAGISGPLDAEANSSFTAHVDASSLAATSGSVLPTGIVTQFQFTEVPEPSTFAFGVLGAVLIGFRHRRATLQRTSASPSN